MTRWYRERKREHYYKKAKKIGYRSRSAYKLIQIQRRYNIFKEGDKVVDLGAAPGGWSQVANEFVGENGKIIGIDLEPIAPIDNIDFIQGDITNKDFIKLIKEKLDFGRVDVVISDLSPNISGNYSVDQARSVFLCEKALEITDIILKKGGKFVCKIFEGEDSDIFIKKIKNLFTIVKLYSPNASRKSSSEIYIISRFFKITSLN
jgi:23S rRNA (uridine2552-2'-O)-methyltransferase